MSCAGGNDGEDSVFVTGGSPPYSYAWSSGGSSAVESGLTAGIYSVTVTDSANCSSSASDTVAEQFALSVTVVLIQPP